MIDPRAEMLRGMLPDSYLGEDAEMSDGGAATLMIGFILGLLCGVASTIIAILL